jgi:hypothetical protein
MANAARLDSDDDVVPGRGRDDDVDYSTGDSLVIAMTPVTLSDIAYT